MNRRARIHPRWAAYLRTWKGPMGKVQVHFNREEVSGRSMRLPEPVIRLAQEEYDRQYPGQPYERMQERGGLSVLEMIGFMADRIERVEKLGPWAEPQQSERGFSAADLERDTYTDGPDPGGQS